MRKAWNVKKLNIKNKNYKMLKGPRAGQTEFGNVRFARLS